MAPSPFTVGQFLFGLLEQQFLGEWGGEDVSPLSDWRAPPGWLSSFCLPPQLALGRNPTPALFSSPYGQMGADRTQRSLHLE